MPFEFNNLPPVRMGKLIPRNFGHIKHLSGSKMIDNKDVLIDKQIEEYLTVKKNSPKGLVGVKGKIEGIVYNYEHNNEHQCCAKFVSNPLMGTINPEISPLRKNEYSRNI